MNELKIKYNHIDIECGDHGTLVMLIDEERTVQEVYIFDEKHTLSSIKNYVKKHNNVEFKVKFVDENGFYV